MLPRPQRSTLLAGAVFAVTAVVYVMIGVDSADTPATTAIPVYVVTTASTTAPVPTVEPTPTTLSPASSDATTPEPTTSVPTTTAPEG